MILIGMYDSSYTRRVAIADIAVACYATHLRESLPLDLSPWPALRAHVDRCEALPVFRQHYIPFDAPVPDAAKEA